VVGAVAEGGDADSPRASGTLDAHYAPRTALLLMPREALVAEARQQEALGKRIAVLAIGELPDGLRGLALPAGADGYAHGLYAALRSLDALGTNLLLAERPPSTRDWLAVNDRLRRSAAGAGLDRSET
jgi:L-threonylcarbamoyladenylate synthase